MDITKTRPLGVRDVAKEYGSTAQYWSSLMTRRKLKFIQTSSGRITCPQWVEEYLQNRLPPGRPRKVVDNVS